VLALQRSVGNRATAQHLQRSFTPAPGGGWTVTFHVGTEISVRLAETAYSRTTSGPLTDDDLGELRAIALESGRTIDDHERLFLAALLDAGNAAAFHRANPKGIDTTAQLALDGSAISSDNRDRVKDFGRDVDPTPMALGARAPSAKERILALAGHGFAQAANDVLALAADSKVPLDRVEHAMRAAASDSTPGDRVMAGAAYVIALRAKLPIAADLFAGGLKVDEVSPSTISGTAEYRALGGDGKGDTIYVPTTFDIRSLAYQGLLVHEMTHARDDKAASGFGTADRWKTELAGYRAQGRYWLSELAKLKPAARTAAIDKLAPSANALSILAMLVEQRAARNFQWWGFIEEINRKSPNGLSVSDFGDAQSDDDAGLQERALRAIRTTPAYAALGPTTPFDGLRGESFLDE
jgi:hypothetical protein